MSLMNFNGALDTLQLHSYAWEARYLKFRMNHMIELALAMIDE